MLSDTDLRELLGEVLKIKKDTKKGFTPDFNPIYVESVEMADKVRVHADGTFPDLLFKEKAPNESIKEFEYRKAIYKARTKAFWHKALGVVNRIWNRNNFQIDGFEDKPKFDNDGQRASEYFNDDYPQYNSIESYFESVVTDWKLKDPNAVLAVKPRMLPFMEDENGDLIDDQTELIDPVAIIYSSEQLIKYTEDVSAMILLREKSVVDVGTIKKKIGLIFEVYDEVNIWRLVQVGEQKDFRFEFILYYEHNLGYLPVWKLRGKPLQREEEALFQSYFFPAVPNLDASALNYSNLDISIYTSVFPHKWEMVERCTAQGCVNGLKTFDQKEIECEICAGSGFKSISSSLGTMQVQMPTALNDSSKDVPTPPFGFVSPDPKILEFLMEMIETDIINAFTFMNIDISGDKVKASDTALGKMIDREELFSFLLTMSNELFALLKLAVNAIGEMRYGEDFQEPNIKPPVTFAIRNEMELIEEMKLAKEAGLPLPAFKKLLMEYLAKRFNNDVNLEKMLNLVAFTDTLMTSTEQEILMKLNSGSIAKWEAILHKDIYMFIEEDPEILERELPEAKLELIGKAQAKLALIAPSATNDILDIANAES